MSILDRLLAFVHREPRDDARLVELACRLSEAWAIYLGDETSEPERPAALDAIYNAAHSGGYMLDEHPGGPLLTELSKLDPAKTEEIRRYAESYKQACRRRNERNQATRDMANLALDDYMEATGRERRYGAVTPEKRAKIEAAARSFE